MRQVRYRALIKLDPVEATSATSATSALPVVPSLPIVPRQRRAGDAWPDPRLASIPRQYANHTRALMVRARCLSEPGYARCFPAELSWDDGEPLHPGDRAEVTITMTDDEAVAFFGAGQRFDLWHGVDVGHGTISRQVHTEYGPC